MADQPHDALFRETFSQPAEAAAELRAILPPGVVALFDWDSLKLESGNLVTVDERRFCDLLFRVQRRDGGDPALVFVLFEHQSSNDELMPLRVLGYMVKVWDAWAALKEKNAKALPLPFILPVVLSHDEDGWRSARSMGPLFDDAPGSQVLHDAFVPDFQLVIDDIAKVSDEQLLARALPAAAALTVWALRDGRTPERLLAHVPAFAPIFDRYSNLPWFQRVLDRIFIYLGNAAGSRSVGIETLAEAITQHAPSARGTVMNSIEKLIERGRKEGRLEGRNEGRLEGRQEFLRRLLERKFGPLPPDYTRRLETASPEDLERYVDRLLTADSLAAVFGE